MQYFRPPVGTDISEFDRQELHHDRYLIRAQIAIERGRIQKLLQRENYAEVCPSAADIVAAAVDSWWKHMCFGGTCFTKLRNLPLVCPLRLLDANLLHHINKIGALAADLPVLDATYEIGITYTSLLSKPDRSAGGLFFTPPRLAEHLVDLAAESGTDWATARILEPSCGGGMLIVAVAERIIEAMSGQSNERIIASISDNLVGFELDPFAAWLAQAALDATLLPYTNRAEELPVVVQVCDTLWAETTADFDLVIGNPPYGKLKLCENLKRNFNRSTFGHANAYGLFFDQAARFTRTNGTVVFITPTSFLSGNYSKNLRSVLQTQLSPKTLEFISTRSGVFEGVQQDLVISTFMRSDQFQPVSVRRLDQTSKAGFETTHLGKHLLPTDLCAPWILPRTAKQIHLARALSQSKSTLADWGYRASTGPIVWNRFKDQITSQPHVSSVPLIWAEAVQGDGQFSWQAERKDGRKWFALEKTEDKFLCQESCLLLQRTTSIEQEKRLVVAELPANLIEQYGGVVVENHITMVHPTSAKPPVALRTIGRFLRSEAADQSFRCMSANSVSSTELASLPLPEAASLSVLSGLILNASAQSLIEEECWRLVLSGRDEPQPKHIL